MTCVDITLDADIVDFLPPVIDNLISTRIDAILSAKQGSVLRSDIGDLTNLITLTKEDLVQAINEIYVDYNGKETAYSNILEALLETPFIK